MYCKAAEKLLRALYENHCDFTEENDSILQKGTGSYHSQEHEFPIIYGDYFFMEALFKLKGQDFFSMVIHSCNGSGTDWESCFYIS